MPRVGLGDLFSVEVPDGWRPVAGEGEGPGLAFETGRDAHVGLSPLPSLGPNAPPVLELVTKLSEQGGAGALIASQELDLPSGLPAAKVSRMMKGGVVLHSALVIGPEVTVVITVVCDRKDERVFVPALERMLETIRIPGEPGPGIALAREVAEAIRRAAPGLEVKVEDEDLLLVRNPAGKLEAQLGLSSLAARVAQEPERRAELITEHLARLPLEGLRDGHVDHPPVLAEYLYPRLVPRQRMDTARATAPADYDGPLLRPWSRDETLYVALVATTFDGFRYLTSGDLAGLELTEEQAHAQACENLTRYLEANPPTAMAGPDGKAALIVFHNQHAAAVLLLPSFHGAISRHLGQEFTCCAPALDELVAFRSSDKKLAAATIEKAQASFHSDPYPVTKQVFTVGPDGPRPASAGGKSWWKPW